jgi:hypothetical protein
MYSKTIEFLEKEIKILEQARDGVGRAWNILKRDNIEDNYLKDLYNEFDSKIKSHKWSIEALNNEIKTNSVTL